MKYGIACLTALVLLLGFSSAGLAHRVNIFAFVDGDAIQVECSFSKSQKVRNGKVVATDLETGANVFEGVTDERGVLRFRPGADFLKTGHGLNLLLVAGEGHQNDWQVSPEELAALEPDGRPAVLREEAVAGEHTPPAPGRPAVAAPAPDAAHLEALIGKVMDAKLAPIKQTLARQAESGPGLRDIVGGIGWILGLLGLATYMKYRR